jgi:ParB family chromosome partitioning protein
MKMLRPANKRGGRDCRIAPAAHPPSGAGALLEKEQKDMELKPIDIACLSVSPANMRGVKKQPDLTNILPSVRARGILVPLIVWTGACPEPVEGGSPATYEIVAGKRRYHAALVVAQESGGIDPLP